MYDFPPHWLVCCVPHVGFQAFLFKCVGSPDVQPHTHGLPWAHCSDMRSGPFITQSQAVLLVLLAKPHASPLPGVPSPPLASCLSPTHPLAPGQIHPSTMPHFFPPAHRISPAYHSALDVCPVCAFDTSQPPLIDVAANVLSVNPCTAI